MPLSADSPSRIRKHTRSVQVLAGERRDNHDDGRRPFQLDRCHALDTGGEAVRLYYPRWRREAKTGTD